MGKTALRNPNFLHKKTTTLPLKVVVFMVAEAGLEPTTSGL